MSTITQFKEGDYITFDSEKGYMGVLLRKDSQSAKVTTLDEVNRISSVLFKSLDLIKNADSRVNKTSYPYPSTPITCPVKVIQSISFAKSQLTLNEVLRIDSFLRRHELGHMFGYRGVWFLIFD